MGAARSKKVSRTEVVAVNGKKRNKRESGIVIGDEMESADSWTGNLTSTIGLKRSDAQTPVESVLSEEISQKLADANFQDSVHRSRRDAVKKERGGVGRIVVSGGAASTGVIRVAPCVEAVQMENRLAAPPSAVVSVNAAPSTAPAASPAPVAAAANEKIINGDLEFEDLEVYNEDENDDDDGGDGDKTKSTNRQKELTKEEQEKTTTGLSAKTTSESSSSSSAQQMTDPTPETKLTVAHDISFTSGGQSYILTTSDARDAGKSPSAKSSPLSRLPPLKGAPPTRRGVVLGTAASASAAATAAASDARLSAAETRREENLERRAAASRKNRERAEEVRRRRMERQRKREEWRTRVESEKDRRVESTKKLFDELDLL